MMRIVLICLLLPLSVWAKEPLTLVAEEFPPFGYLEGEEYKGIDVDILNEVAKRLGIAIEIRFYPWARAMKMAKKGDVDAIFALHRNGEREQYFYYAEEPLSYETAVLIVPKKSTRKANMLEDIEGWKVAQIRDTSYSRQFDSFDLIDRVWVNSNKQSLDLLNLQRIDAAVYNELIFNYRTTVLNELSGFKKLDLTVSKEPQHVVFSKAKGEKYEAMAKRFSDVIQTLRKEGFIKKVVRKYSALSLE